MSSEENVLERKMKSYKRYQNDEHFKDVENNKFGRDKGGFSKKEKKSKKMLLNYDDEIFDDNFGNYEDDLLKSKKVRAGAKTHNKKYRDSSVYEGDEMF